ncbi:UNVERIFIED_CONTAM: hypothetical protein K2H54_010343 [Gekko kuhli]
MHERPVGEWCIGIILVAPDKRKFVQATADLSIAACVLIGTGSVRLDSRAPRLEDEALAQLRVFQTFPSHARVLVLGNGNSTLIWSSCLIEKDTPGEQAQKVAVCGGGGLNADPEFNPWKSLIF